MCVCGSVRATHKCEDLFKHALLCVCMSLCDCVHGEINLGTSTFSIDPMCVCVCVCVYERAWQATGSAGNAIRDLTGEIFESANHLRGSDSTHDWWVVFVFVRVGR